MARSKMGTGTESHPPKWPYHLTLTRSQFLFRNSRTNNPGSSSQRTVPISGRGKDILCLRAPTLADVIGVVVPPLVEPEPIESDNPLIGVDRVVLTPHIGSRTYESVGRQAMMAVKNLLAIRQANLRNSVCT